MPRVLIVDDVHDNVKLLAYNLGDEGYDVLTAYSGSQAICVAAEESPDVILLDIMMPVMDGIEACRRLKADSKLRHIPVIMVSALDREEQVIKGLDAGAMDYVTKPFSFPIILARIRSAVRIKTSHDMLEDMNTQLDKAKAEATVASRSKGEFLANMSHEIRTPMTAIQGFAETLLESDLSEEDRINAIHTIWRNGRYLLGIINDILDLSRIESGKLDVEYMRCDPCQVLAEVLSLMQVRADEKQLSLAIEYESSMPHRITTDPTRLRQILINLTSNAVKFTENGGVRIVARFLDESGMAKMQFDVYDSGVGMSTEQVERLFQPFMQADNSTSRKYGGTGLGLTISKKLAAILNGELHLMKTSSTSGTCFRLTINAGLTGDLDFVEDPMAATTISDSTPNLGEAYKLPPCHILLAEDGPDNQKLITHFLKKAGAEVTVVENGQLAVEAVIETQKTGSSFDCVLMDIQMPILDGYDATSQLRELGFEKPIIALTAHAMASDREKCLTAGCDDYSTKPINRKKLMAIISKHLSRSRGVVSHVQ